MNNESNDLAGMKILLVDDVSVNIEILFKALSTRNYQIFMANNGVKALELVSKLRPDLILLDIMMPEMDGIETCRRLKADASTRDIPVIFITAKTEVEDVVEGFNVGGWTILANPFVCKRCWPGWRPI
jgi:CheY-like chemotaxis protein